MKGILFNAFEQYVSEKFEENDYDTIVASCKIETKEPFVGPGTYPDNDFMSIVNCSSKHLNLHPDELLKGFGHFLFPKLAAKFSNFVDNQKNAKTFLLTIESIIHVEVRKMYDRAYTPTFQYFDNHKNELIIRYHSKRKLYKLMEGIIMGVADYFGCRINQEIKIHTIEGEEFGDFNLKFIP